MAIDPTWIGVVGALGGVAVGALAEGVRSRVSFQREKAWSLEDERKSHFEDIYEMLEQFREVYSRWYIDALSRAVPGQRSSLKLPDRAVPWSRMQMLVHLYVPELKPQLTLIEKVGPAMGAAIADGPLVPVRSSAQFEAAVAPLDLAYRQLNGAVDAMRDKIVELAKESRIRKHASAGQWTA